MSGDGLDTDTILQRLLEDLVAFEGEIDGDSVEREEQESDDEHFLVAAALADEVVSALG